MKQAVIKKLIFKKQEKGAHLGSTSNDLVIISKHKFSTPHWKWTSREELIWIFTSPKNYIFTVVKKIFISQVIPTKDYIY